MESRQYDKKLTAELKKIISKKPSSINNADIKMIFDLLDRNANPNVKSDRESNRTTLLHLFIRLDYLFNVSQTHPKYFDALKRFVQEYHADINITDKAKLTPLKSYMTLHYYEWKSEFIRDRALDLLKLGANPKSKDGFGVSLRRRFLEVGAMWSYDRLQEFLDPKSDYEEEPELYSDTQNEAVNTLSSSPKLKSGPKLFDKPFWEKTQQQTQTVVARPSSPSKKS